MRRAADDKQCDIQWRVYDNNIRLLMMSILTILMK